MFSFYRTGGLHKHSSVLLRSMSSQPAPPFTKVMSANRGEIAVRINRAANELKCRTVGIFAWEDRHAQHRYKADESYLLNRDRTPVGAYLDKETVIEIAKANGVGAIHPGYGFLSENAEFAQMCADNGIAFVGPTVKNLQEFADKTTARQMAIKANVPVVPGTDGPISDLEGALEFTAEYGYPIIIKAAMGGGGKGMRVVKKAEEMKQSFESAQNEALKAFGDGTVFLERFVEKPRHIEIQILGDKEGNVVHLHERDCSVQRRHQKAVEMAPALNLSDELRATLHADAVRLTKEAGYLNAGTVEFLIGPDGRHYFIEVNPRIQVEHTVTEEVTGVDLVQTQIRLAGGETLASMGLTQDKIKATGNAIQCRVTTEDPSKGFSPDTGLVTTYRSAEGRGIRLDGVGFAGMNISPHYDSMLCKITARDKDFQGTVSKMTRALSEFRIRGVNTNVYFLQNVLRNPDFKAKNGAVTTAFIDENPDLVSRPAHLMNRGEKLLGYLANLAVNGHPKELGATGAPCSDIDPVIPATPVKAKAEDGLRDVFVKEGPAAFAKKVREHKGLLLTDTTWRDAHQSLLATRVRTTDLLNIAPATAVALKNAYSIECWGGATFDVSMRFLRECPWDRLQALREQVPNVPFQMLLRGANAVGYTSYPDNAVHKFCDMAVKNGMDVFRVFDSVNYIENMKLGIDAVGTAGGIVEATCCYTGDVSDPSKGKYTLDYYLDYVRQLDALGIHVLNIKDMAGLLKPKAATMLIGAIRKEFPHLPIHVHTHDTAGTGVASMIACAHAGADAVDVATDAMSGMTSQPSMGAVVASLAGTELDTGIKLEDIQPLNDYWELTRGLYAPFESGQKSGNSDVYENEIPGGQYTNLMFQSSQLGLADKFSMVKKNYAAANRLLGDIIKVTPSSKVVGDLAQFMVANDLSEQDVHEQAASLSFPNSVVEYFQGYLGIPKGGFPEPLRSHVIKDTKLPNGESVFSGRPGAEMEPIDFDAIKAELDEKFPAGMHHQRDGETRDVDVMSYIMYPKVYEEAQAFNDKYGDLRKLPTRAFLKPMQPGDEMEFDLEKGKTMFIHLRTITEPNEKGERNVFFHLNGEQRVVRVKDEEAARSGNIKVAEKAAPGDKKQLGAPMPGVVVEMKRKVGDTIEEGEPLVVLSAMKMETVVTATSSGKITKLAMTVGDDVEGGDLLVQIE